MSTLPQTLQFDLTGDLKKLEGYDLKLAVARQKLAPYEGMQMPNAAEYQAIKAIKKEIGALRREADEYRKQIKAPFKEAVDQIDALGRTVQAHISSVETEAERLTLTYENEQARIEREALQAKEKRHALRVQTLSSMEDVYADKEYWLLNEERLITKWDVMELDDEAFDLEVQRIQERHAEYITHKRKLENRLRDLEARIAETAPTHVPEPTLTGTERAPYATDTTRNEPIPTASRLEVLRAKIAGVLGECCKEKIEEILEIIKPQLR